MTPHSNDRNLNSAPSQESRDKMRCLRNIVTATAIFLVLFPTKLSYASERVSDWRFVDITGKKHAPFNSEKTKALVVVFICTDCPIANYFQPTLRDMAKKYETQGVRFVMIHPDLECTRKAAKKHAMEYSITIPIALDHKQKMAKRLKAEFTPEAFVIAPQGDVRYRGRINDMYVSYGKKRHAPTRNDLDEAIEALLAGKEVVNPKTKPVGCPIFYPEANGTADLDARP
jgi:thiol-disulfide isomerase/thioredoxin